MQFHYRLDFSIALATVLCRAERKSGVLPLLSRFVTSGRSGVSGVSGSAERQSPLVSRKRRRDKFNSKQSIAKGERVGGDGNLTMLG